MQLITVLLPLLFPILSIAQIPLAIEMDRSKGLNLTQSRAGEYIINTQDRNASFQLAPLQQNLAEEIQVLSFDYFCLTGLEYLGWNTNQDLSPRERRLIRDFPIAEGWSTYSIDISEKREAWGTVGDFLKIYLGNRLPTEIRIKNIELRAYTEKEQRQIAQKEQKLALDARLEKDIPIYLQKNHACEVSRVEVGENSIQIAGNRKGLPGEIYLCEVPIFGNLTEKEFLSITKVTTRQSFTLTIDRFIQKDGQQYDRLYSRWVLAQKTQKGYFICSHAHYPDEVQSAHDLKQELPASRKGLGGYSAFRSAPESDLDDLGITSATVNIWVNQFLRSAPTEHTLSFVYNGKTYYADEKAVRRMDTTLISTAKRNIVVSAIILISPQRKSDDPEIGRLLEHPDFDPAGIYSMPNMTNLESFNLYAAAMDFLANRYSRPDKKYGRIHHWIAHNEVDAGWVWTNMGEKTALVFMDTYLKSMRMMYYTARKYNPHAEVLITLTHYWQERHNQYCYPSALLLDILIDYTKAEGDFKWGVAHHPYPESLFEPKSWLDTKVDFTYNTQQITFKNLEVLDAWIKQKRALYQGKTKRTLYLSEQGPNSKDYSTPALLEQAAGMAYAWKKMEDLEGIDAFQFHNWQDNRIEGGLRIGLRRFPDDEEKPGGTKPVWDVFQALETDKEEEVCAFAKDLIGIDTWEEVKYKGPIEPKSSPLTTHLQADTWVATDALGRRLPTYEECGPKRENRFVGMFYFLTHNQNGENHGPNDVTQIKAANPANPQWGEGAHYWGEPETGYYIMQDEWMIRRHARLLADAGVDVIILDVTNDVIYEDNIHFIAQTFRKMRAEGEVTPQIACLASYQSTLQLWEKIYHKGLYPELWFQWQGKPLLMFGQHKIPKRDYMDDVVFPKAIQKFFTIKQSWAWTTLAWYDNGENEWPWIDHYPQSIGWSSSPDQAEYVPVAVAQHPLSNIGRSFHQGEQPQKNKLDLTAFTHQGLHFEEQWQRALEVEPQFVFVTGWNEWTAGKKVRTEADLDKEMQFWDFFVGADLGKVGSAVKMGEAYFIDQYNQEYSRDIEPMKGGHTDNYYYQLISNIRKYKGVSQPIKVGPERTIQLSGSFDQWKKVTKTYYDHVNDTYPRNSPGNYSAGPYSNATGRNDIIEAKVARDQQQVFFYVKTAAPLSAHTDPNWMLLFIDTDQNANTGWEGYDILINQDRQKGNKTSIAKFRNGQWETVGAGQYHYHGNELMIAVNRKWLDEQRLSFDFHWADNIQKIGDITSFFLHGDQAPMRRSNYRYEE